MVCAKPCKARHGKYEPEDIKLIDWDGDGKYDHTAIYLGNGKWIWASTSAGKVIEVDQNSPGEHKHRWEEIKTAQLQGKCTVVTPNWGKWGKYKKEK